MGGQKSASVFGLLVKPVLQVVELGYFGLVDFDNFLHLCDSLVLGFLQCPKAESDGLDFIILLLDVGWLFRIFLSEQEIVVLYFLGGSGDVALDLIDFDCIFSLLLGEGIEEFSEQFSHFGLYFIPLELLNGYLLGLVAPPRIAHLNFIIQPINSSSSLSFLPSMI